MNKEMLWVFSCRIRKEFYTEGMQHIPRLAGGDEHLSCLFHLLIAASFPLLIRLCFRKGDNCFQEPLFDTFTHSRTRTCLSSSVSQACRIRQSVKPLYRNWLSTPESEPRGSSGSSAVVKQISFTSCPFLFF